MKLNIFKLVLMLLLGTAVCSCTWFEEDYSGATYELVSISQKSPETDFSQFKTFAVTDKMNYVDDEGKKRKKTDDSERIRAIVIENMRALGYTLIEDGSTDPDLAIDMSYVISTTSTYYPGYWWGWDYWYWWDPYMPYYPYYPYSPGYVSSYSAGILVLEIAAVPSNDYDKMPIVWQGIVRGVLTGMHSKVEQQEAINKCFEIMPPVNNR